MTFMEIDLLSSFTSVLCESRYHFWHLSVNNIITGTNFSIVYESQIVNIYDVNSTDAYPAGIQNSIICIINLIVHHTLTQSITR